MLQNAYFLAKIGADTAENEPNFTEIVPKFGNYPPGSWRRLRGREGLFKRATARAPKRYTRPVAPPPAPGLLQK